MKSALKILLFLLLTNTPSFSQDHIRFGIYQDVKLAVTTDDYGNQPFTTDMIFRLTLEGYQRGNSYSSIIVEYEGAYLSGGELHRWTTGYGQNFNQILDNFTISPSLQFGIIARPNTTFTGLGNLDIYYTLGRFQLGMINQFMLRTDLETMPVRYSMFMGINFAINN